MNKSHYLQKRNFSDENRYPANQKRHGSYQRNPFGSENGYLGNSMTQSILNRNSKASLQKNMEESCQLTVENGCPVKSWIKSDESSHFKGDRNMRFLNSKQQTSENFPMELYIKNDIYKNVDLLYSENNVYFKTKNNPISSIEISPEASKFTAVYESGNELNIKHYKQNYLNISTGTKEYCPLDSKPKYVSNSSDVTKFDTFYGYKDCQLLELLYYNVDLMQDQQLFEYSFALKEKTLEIMPKLKDSEKMILEFLCEMTNEFQTQNNQKIFTIKMYNVLHRIFENVLEEPNLGDSYPIPHNFPVSSDATLKIADEHDLNCEYDKYMNYPKSVINATFTEENSRKRNFSECSIREKEQWFPDNCEHISTPIPNISSDSCSNYYSQNDFQRSPGTGSQTFYSIEEPLDKFSMLNARVSQSFSDNVPPNIYHYLTLENLLNYDINKMHGSSLLEYAFILKKIVLENISNFSDPTKEKLEYLCDLTDGTQLEKNQRLITRRMCYLVTTFFMGKPKEVPLVYTSHEPISL